MASLWSFSTTVRNPQRLREFLRVLAEMEGKEFDEDGQIQYQTRLIQHRLYRPTDLTREEVKIYENPDEPFPYHIARDIFLRQEYKDPSMRGRQSANPLNKLGFAVARGGAPIQITELGKRFIQEGEESDSVFLPSMVRMQFPNPTSPRDFTAKQGYNIRPFVATLTLLKRVNAEFGAGGLTGAEFSLFIPSLSHHSQIDERLEQVRAYRASTDKKAFIQEFAEAFYGHTPSEEEVNNFFEYGDNIMRYFRMTRLMRVTRSGFGADWRIDLEPLRTRELDIILKTESVEAKEFETPEAYIAYLGSAYDAGFSTAVLEEVRSHVIEQGISATGALGDQVSEFVTIDIEAVTDRGAYIERGRTLVREVLERERGKKLYHDTNRLKEIIDSLRDSQRMRKIEPEEFEYMAAQALMIIDDEELIKPNYVADDTGQPIGHASGNQADIEAFYESFNMVIEVTKDSGTTQWIRETAPVMRHLHEFMAAYPEKEAYCIFIAPRIHPDTVYHYRVANTHGYNGQPQRIVPLTSLQFADVLEVYHDRLIAQDPLKHAAMHDFLSRIAKVPAEKPEDDWLQKIEQVFKEWRERQV